MSVWPSGEKREKMPWRREGSFFYLSVWYYYCTFAICWHSKAGGKDSTKVNGILFKLSCKAWGGKLCPSLELTAHTYIATVSSRRNSRFGTTMRCGSKNLFFFFYTGGMKIYASGSRNVLQVSVLCFSPSWKFLPLFVAHCGGIATYFLVTHC